MKKKIRDVTFKEFDNWCNTRACDGRWSLSDAIHCSTICSQILSIKPIFGRSKKREKEWEKIRGEVFNLDMEINID